MGLLVFFYLLAVWPRVKSGTGPLCHFRPIIAKRYLAEKNISIVLFYECQQTGCKHNFSGNFRAELFSFFLLPRVQSTLAWWNGQFSFIREWLMVTARRGVSRPLRDAFPGSFPALSRPLRDPTLGRPFILLRVCLRSGLPFRDVMNHESANMFTHTSVSEKILARPVNDIILKRIVRLETVLVIWSLEEKTGN